MAFLFLSRTFLLVCVIPTLVGLRKTTHLPQLPSVSDDHCGGNTKQGHDSCKDDRCNFATTQAIVHGVCLGGATGRELRRVRTSR